VRLLAELSRTGWARAAGIALRTAHLAAMALLVGAVHLAPPGAALEPWRAITVGTGLLLLALEASHSPHWVYQGRGVATVLHVVALGLVAVPVAGPRAATLAALGIGAVGSHLPRVLRKWSFRHRRVVE
jgi:hypothetical protein